MSTMKCIRLPEGRAALAFDHESEDTSVAQKEAAHGASRRHILKEWLSFPQWFRRDQGFQCLMDNYCPVDEETMEMQKRRQNEMVYDTIKQLFGSEGLKHLPSANGEHPRIPTDDEIARAIAALSQRRAAVDIFLPFGGQTLIGITGNTAKTVAAMQGRTGQSVRMWGFDIGFDGTTSTNGPGIVEIMKNTLASNSGSATSVTPLVIDFGRPETVQSTGLKGFTQEPTVLTTTEVFFIPNYMGSGIVFTPLTKPFILSAGSTNNGGSMRCTGQSGVNGNATGTLKGEE